MPSNLPTLTSNDPADIQRYILELFNAPLPLWNRPKASLPSAADYYHGDMTYAVAVSDASTGQTVCVSDGTDWIDQQTGSAVV